MMSLLLVKLFTSDFVIISIMVLFEV